MTTLVFDGCDPGSGEDTLNEFIVPASMVCDIAAEFFRTRQMPTCVQWLQL